MTIATFAFTLGILELLFGLPMLVNPTATRDWLLKFVKNIELYRIIGAAFLIVCALPLFAEPRVTADLAGVIRAIAWFGAVKCLVICWWPGWLASMGERMMASTAVCRLWGAVATGAGVFFTWAGFTLTG